MECILSKIDKNKKAYKPKGYGKIVAIILTIIFFYSSIYVIAPYYWPKTLDNPNLFILLFSMLNHSISYILCNLFLYIVYHLEIDFFERYKVHEFIWPWNVDREKWIKFLSNSLLLISFNHLIVVPMSLAFRLYLVGGTYIRFDYASLPGIFEILWQIPFFIILEDFGSYWSHRFLHWNLIYPYIHKIHHDYKNTISIASEHTHPIEFVLGNIVPTNLGLFVLRDKVHLLTQAIWIIIRVLKTTEGHCGYQFSWSPTNLLPFLSSDYHNFHHSKGFNSNYGSFTEFWDKICGTTNPEYIKWQNEKFEKM